MKINGARVLLLVCGVLLACTFVFVRTPIDHTILDNSRVASTEYVSRDGVLLRVTLNATDERCMWRNLDQISSTIPAAFIAIEDSTFRTHHGVNVASLMRATWNNLRGKPKSGASTMTMQLASMLFGHQNGISGKVRQILFALRLEYHLSKAEILTHYLNRVPLGKNINGVEAASFRYFGHSAHEATIGEAALLASLAASPVTRDASRNSDLAREVTKRALKKMGQNENQLPTIRVTHWPNLAGHAVDMTKGTGRIQVSIDSKIQMGSVRNFV
jgi:penicillin-binding protein 1C